MLTKVHAWSVPTGWAQLILTSSRECDEAFFTLSNVSGVTGSPPDGESGGLFVTRRRRHRTREQERQLRYSQRNERRHPAIEELNDALVGGVIALGLVMPDRR